MAYLVTGGGGLIGSRIVRDLALEGEQVVSYARSPQQDLLEQLVGEEERIRIATVQGDITDLAQLMRSVQQNNVDKIIHLASLVTFTSAANPPLAIRVNCEGTANVFETARILGVNKVVWASSIAVFGSPEYYAEEYIPNDALHCPSSVYGGTKSFNEVLASHYIDEYGLDISAIRYCFVYGMGQRWGFIGQVMRELIQNPVLGKPGRVPYGEDAFSWLYVNDASRATIRMSRVAKPKTKAFTIAGEIRSVKEAVEYVKSLLPDADIVLLPGRMSASTTWKYDIAPLREEIGHSPQWSLEEGLRDSLNMVRRQQGLTPL